MKKISAFRSFLMISAVFFPSVDSKCCTWFEAQYKCAKQNKTLPTKFPSSQVQGNGNTYWTRYSQRKSNWTQLLGCYPDSKVSGGDKAESMSIPSVGMCQEICASYSTFAVKFTTCICLQTFPSADQERLTTEHCNKSCGDIPSQPFTRQCGGEDAYNVYRSIDSMNFPNEGGGMCLSIQCSTKSKIYGVGDCTKNFYTACEKVQKQDKWDDWTSSMKFCETQLSSYLLGGDLLLTNITSDCTKILNVNNRPSIENWIGVARQIYIRIDQGYPVMNKGDFTDCRQCSRNNCSYVPCSNQNEFICSDKVDSSTSTHSASPNTELSSSPQTPTPSAITENTEFKTTVPTTSDKDQKEIVAAIVTPIVVLLGAVIAFGIIYFRRCKGNATNESTNSKSLEAENSESHQYACVDNSNIIDNVYLALEHGSHNSELDNTTKSESESPYYNLAEGEYSNVQ